MDAERRYFRAQSRRHAAHLCRGQPTVICGIEAIGEYLEETREGGASLIPGQRH